ncbi:hypothetical protein LTR95_018570 [Oleoguttula sp. CCFEE 5521]|uniref:Uncharacterized protein n=1 Tax=Cryoendolithus antarcticus TaxID=1507870 RepID=A0A1V8SLP0_9PEZI|nr:hypothetical protein B0A48_14561 [Cryoendolithus antarcticus]OQO11299.1 hypothetical protein B0A48_05555 [Cryoendolithus antarcticus]OQO15393.1 hypothetical protein B0A51_16878 [Rachicladosporium sp. CCFEE 5018]
MATKLQSNGAAKAPNGVAAPKRPTTTRAPVKKAAPGTTVRPKSAKPIQNKAASVAGDNPSQGVGGAYAIMASRIANRVAEMAESITFVERQKPQAPASQLESVPEEKKKPRKLEMRLPPSASDSIAFSAPFLDNTLQMMLQLQNRMLTSTAKLSKSEGVDEQVVKENAAQSAELSRIIAMICAEKARQGS